MKRHIYADEAGNFDFSTKRGATRFFILTTVTIDDHRIELDLLDLRRDLAWSGIDLAREFHATEDKQLVRDRVFEVLSRHDFRVDATVLEKAKAQPPNTPNRGVVLQIRLVLPYEVRRAESGLAGRRLASHCGVNRYQAKTEGFPVLR